MTHILDITHDERDAKVNGNPFFIVDAIPRKLRKLMSENIETYGFEYMY